MVVYLFGLFYLMLLSPDPAIKPKQRHKAVDQGYSRVTARSPTLSTEFTKYVYTFCSKPMTELSINDWGMQAAAKTALLLCGAEGE